MFFLYWIDFETVNHRINKYVKGASVTHHLPIAEALINRHGSDDDSSRFIPFVGVSTQNVYVKVPTARNFVQNFFDCIGKIRENDYTTSLVEFM